MKHRLLSKAGLLIDLLSLKIFMQVFVKEGKHN